MKKRCLLTAYISCVAMGVFAQINLSGSVIDAQTGKPIEGANVRFEQTNVGCATNKDGKFVLKNAKDGTYTLRTSCLNYNTVSQKISKSQKDMVIKLKNTAFNLDQVVITGTGTHHKLKDSPVPVEVISQRDLQNVNPNSFQDALVKLVPSISVQTTAMGTTLYVNGLPDKYLLVLINGKKIAGDISGSIDYDRINMNAVKRIEVLKGASSALYGSDAIAGVINIITDDPKSALNVSSNTRVSSHDRISEGVSIDANDGKLSAHVDYNYLSSGGWQLSPYEESGDKLVETTKQPVYKNHSHNVSQNLNYAATDRLTVGLNGNLYISENDRTGAYDYNNRHQSYTFGGTAKYLLPKKASFIEAMVNTTNYRSYYDYINDAKTHKKGDEVLSKNQAYTNANLKGVFKTHSNNTLFTGLDYVYEGLEPTETSAMLNNEYQNVYTLAAYVQDEVKLFDALSVVAGVRYAYNEKFKSQFTPKLSLMYQYSGLNVRASYANGFRSPTLQQMYAISESRGQITVGDPNLDPEKSNFYNLNVEYNHRFFSVAASIYQNDLKDKIEVQEIERTPEDIENGIKYRRQYRNIQKARVRGFDVGFSLRPFNGFTLGANYIYTDGRNRTENTRLERTVRHSGNCNASWRKSWDNYTLNVAVNGRYQGTRWSEAYGNAPAHQLWDINTRHSFNLKSIVLEPSIGIENIFDYTDDRPYNSNYATLSPGRSLYASLLIRFKQ